MENQTPEQIAQHYKAMLDSVWLINAIIAGEQNGDKDTVDRNVKHLELMVDKDFWTTEDMTPVNAAIESGNAFTALIF
jgi:hypothetical protein